VGILVTRTKPTRWAVLVLFERLTYRTPNGPEYRPPGSDLYRDDSLTPTYRPW
jgi:hypothetical protein